MVATCIIIHSEWLLKILYVYTIIACHCTRVPHCTSVIVCFLLELEISPKYYYSIYMSCYLKALSYIHSKGDIILYIPHVLYIPEYIQLIALYRPGVCLYWSTLDEWRKKEVHGIHCVNT